MWLEQNCKDVFLVAITIQHHLTITFEITRITASMILIKK